MSASGGPNTCEPLARARYQAALASAIVAGLFSLIIIVALGVAHIRTRTDEFQKTKFDELAALRAALLKAPDAATAARIREELRDRDLRMREDYFASPEFSKTGGYLLAGGVLIFVIAAVQVAACRKRLPMPRPDPDAPRKAAGAQKLARATVVGLGLAIGAAGVALGLLSGGSVFVQPPAAEEGGAAKPPAASDFPTAEEIAKQWPRFRGPGGLGVSAYTNVPATWNGKTGENILWKTPVPLPGENSPVVWADRVFLSGATPEKREVHCFDAADGKLLWQKPVETPVGAAMEPPEVLEDTGFACPTTATDGRRVVAMFANGDIACFDYAGKRLWARNLGPIKSSYGYASSLNLYRGTVLVLLDQGTPGKMNSSVLALDLGTGKTAWEARRQVPNSWATPTLVNTGQREELITCARPWVTSYDPATGKELWQAKVLDGDIAPSPVFGGGMIFAVNTGAKLAAIRAGGQGDITATHLAWTAEDGLPEIVSPLTDGKIVLLVTTDGTLTCYAASDGKKLWEKELDHIFKSSPTLVGDRIYLMTEKGLMFIFAASAEGYKELGKAELGEEANSSPAYLDGRIYIRAKHNLYCVGKK
jgi:outer membrane protein assembly factor BamB